MQYRPPPCQQDHTVHHYVSTAVPSTTISARRYNTPPCQQDRPPPRQRDGTIHHHISTTQYRPPPRQQDGAIHHHLSKRQCSRRRPTGRIQHSTSPPSVPRTLFCSSTFEGPDKSLQLVTRYGLGMPFGLAPFIPPLLTLLSALPPLFSFTST